nr:hypothetical protein [Tanacetum cinerariifolium]
MLKEASEDHFVRKSHVGTFGYTYHSIGNVVCKVKWFTDSETIEHIAKAGIRVVFVPNEAYGIFTKDDLPFHKIGLQFGVDHLEGIESDVYSFDLTGLAKRVNLLVYVEKTINSNGCKSRENVRLVSKECKWRCRDDQCGWTSAFFS